MGEFGAGLGALIDRSIAGRVVAYGIQCPCWPMANCGRSAQVKSGACQDGAAGFVKVP